MEIIINTLIREQFSQLVSFEKRDYIVTVTPEFTSSNRCIYIIDTLDVTGQEVERLLQEKETEKELKKLVLINEELERRASFDIKHNIKKDKDK